MTEPDSRIKVAILALPEVTASTLFGMFDLFSSPGRDFAFITAGKAGAQRMRPFVVSLDGRELQAANGVWVRPDYSLADCPQPDIVCIPDFYVDPGASLGGLHNAEARWLKHAHRHGAIVASACSGALMIGEAGLLSNCEATIHWGYVASLAKNFPDVQVRAERSLVLSGEAQRIVMAGGGSSWQDLALYLIGRYVGLKEALEVAKVYLLQWHDAGQKPFSSLLTRQQTEDPVIAKCQEWLAMNYNARSPVGAMAKLSGLPDRSFVRRFRKATGMSPLDYAQALRLEEAKQMLEATDLSVEAIANEAGYEDTSFFGRLFRRKMGLTPAQYRVRFGSLRRALTL
jgi:transcriptional regulator GlxA family with amidase domain